MVWVVVVVVVVGWLILCGAANDIMPHLQSWLHSCRQETDEGDWRFGHLDKLLAENLISTAGNYFRYGKLSICVTEYGSWALDDGVMPYKASYK